MTGSLAPPVVIFPPLAPAIEAAFPISEIPAMNFHEMLQNLAAAHEQEVQNLQDEVKRLQALLHPDRTCSARDRNQNSTAVVGVSKENLPSEHGGQGRPREELYTGAPNKPGSNESVAGTGDTLVGSKYMTDPTVCLQPKHTLDITEEEKKHKKSNLHKVLEGRQVTAAMAFIEGPFDGFIGFLVVANAVMMFIEYEYEGFVAAVHLGIKFDDGRWDSAQVVFQIASHIFNLIFCLELLLRLAISKRHFFFNDINGSIYWIAIFDALVVLTTSIDMYIAQPLLGTKTNVNTSAFRLIRLARVTRALRVVRVMHLFTKLRVLVNSVHQGIMSLFWSMVLMAVLMFIGALMMCRFVNPFMMDDSIPMETRLWLYELYGTSTLAAYTMFEVTFAGCWPNYARPLVTKVNAWFGFFWFVYIVIVVFAVTRIITALFLKDTMQVMDRDVQNTIANRILQRDSYIQKLRELFRIADESGDGRLTLEELTSVLKNHRVLHMFASLDLEIHEVWALYNLLEDDGDGAVTYEEFLRGIMRLKGQARALDVIALGRDCENILTKSLIIETRVENILDRMEAIYSSNHDR